MTDLSALSLLPAELQPQTPVLTRQELAVAAQHDDVPTHTLLNAYDALRGDLARLATYIADRLSPPAPALHRYGKCGECCCLLLTEEEADAGRCPWCAPRPGDAAGDADLEIAAGNFRLKGSPFADRRANIPRTVPVAIYRPDMSVGTFAGECRAAEALEEIFHLPDSSPAADRVRDLLAWDADDDDPSPAEAVVIDLAYMKMAMDHRNNCNQLG